MRQSLRLACLVGACAVPWTTAFGEERYIGPCDGAQNRSPARPQEPEDAGRRKPLPT
jgi:hypothetical protein